MNSIHGLKANPDIVKERENADCDFGKLKDFIGKMVFGTVGRYKFIREISKNVLEIWKRIFN